MPMEDVMTAIESVYDRLRSAQEENAKLRKLVADYKALYEDMKAHRDECFKLASDSIRELDAMRSGIKDALEGGAA
jgi:F0F1-type ATP synthase membrane subunit b/b'